ncbi:MAG: hypothetical protein K6T81_12630 [Alicyclobacillus macrosporangiidus]|uniref:beta strand repeat-containing protein n=1 Tax=Alicyclobacillus macrosporangiidus TaxID=392015 RepID=UPI0026F1A4DB|nr:hypothetical protein [Alicyclobacillus macrosporangiidus]MCL6599569.1 hypothetical protein [Alicyclobacillus macrosporangiidus]
MWISKRRTWTFGGIGLAVLLGSLYYSGAYAYTVNNNLSAYGYVVQTSGGYALMGGDDVEVGNGGPWPVLKDQTIHIAQEQADAGDGKDSWGVMLGDMQGANANNGYLLIADPSESSNVQDWVNRLGGNLNYVLNYLQTQNQQVQTYDNANQTSYTYVPFATVVNQSGAIIDTQTVSGPIGTYTDPSTGQTYPEYLYTYPIQPSAPPTANSVSVVDANTNQTGTVKQGDPMNFTVSSNVPLWNSLATHHYVSIQAVNQSNGQSVWLVGSGNTDKSQMQSEQYSQGSYTDQFSFISSAALQPGTYTINAWVCDGVDRVSNAVTTTLTVTPGTPGPVITLTANPTNLNVGDSSMLTATASNAPSQSDTIKIIDQSGKSTLGGQNSYTANSSTSATTTAKDNNAETVNYVAELLSPSGSVLATSNVVSVTWNTSQGSTSCPSQLVDVNQGAVNSTSDTVTLINKTSDPLNFSTDNPSVKLSQTSASAGMDASITATFSSGVDSATLIITDATTNCTQTYPIYDSNYTPPTSSDITLTADPTTLGIGGSTALAATVSEVKPGAFVIIYDETTGQYVGIGAYEKGYSMPPNWTVTMTGVDNGVVTYSGAYSTSYASNTAGSQTFVAYEWDPGVSTVGPPTEKSQSVTVTWVKPTITLSANPTSVFTGQPSKLSYSTEGFASGDYVTIMGSGGQDMWTELKDTNASDSFTEIENPIDGGTTTVQYTANLYNSSGTLLSTSSVTVEWIAPTITMNANPTNNVPGQTSTISYSVNVALPSGYTVQITPDGNGADMWSASGLASQTGSYQETENPPAGQTITVNYTATILDPSGNPIATGGTSVSWANPWTGVITLSANPKFLATGDSTTLTATTTQAVPAGWSLVIMDQTTGQTVSTSGSAPETTQYASFTPETDTFVAFLNDGYEQVGNPSNTQTVVWSQLALVANPTLLPVGQATTLTVSGQNVPSGDYLVIYNQSTGQEVGYSLYTPYSVQVSEPTPQTDTFVAYISSNSDKSGALISSNTVSVDWYSVTLTANPTELPINNTSTLTATAANLPSGYVIDIVDQTTGQTIATGQPGQKTLNVLQTKNQVETDTYVAQVIQPGNPAIPGLSVSGGGYTYEVQPSANDVAVIDPTTGSTITTIPVGQYPSRLVYTGSLVYVTNQLSNTVSVINPTTNTVVDTIGGGWFNYPYGIAYGNGNVYVGNWAGSIANSSVTVVSTSTNQPIINVYSGGMGAMGVTYNNGYVYVVNVLSDNVGVINASNNQEVFTYALPPNTFTFTTESGMTYVSGPSTVTVPYPAGSNVTVSSFGTGSVTVGTGTSQFPFWTFTSAPSYVPTSLFTGTAQSSTDGNGSIWVNGSPSQQNGTAFFQGTLNLSQTQSVTFSMPYVDDYAQVYVDGQPIMQNGNSGGVGGSIPNTSSTTVTLPAGQHQVIIEAMNNNGFCSINANSAGVSLNVTSGGQTLLSTSNPSSWTTTGYVTQLPSGWFSGAVGTWNWTEYVLQENQSQPIYEQQSFSVTTTAQNVSATSLPVSVTWYSNDLELSANPTALPVGQATQLTATSIGGPAGDVIEIYDLTTNQVVGTSSPNAKTFTASWTENKPQTDTFIAYFVNPSNGKQDASSNTVSVQWQQVQLVLSDAEVYHTPAWQQHLDSYNDYYTNVDPQPSLVRAESDFWAGENLLFRVKPSKGDIAVAEVFLPPLSISPNAPTGTPVNFSSPPPIELTYDPSDGYLKGSIPSSWFLWLQYLEDNTYTVTFWVKSKDNQVATAQAQFSIRNKWVSGNDPGTYFHEHEIW